MARARDDILLPAGRDYYLTREVDGAEKKTSGKNRCFRCTTQIEGDMNGVKKYLSYPLSTQPTSGRIGYPSPVFSVNRNSIQPPFPWIHRTPRLKVLFSLFLSLNSFWNHFVDISVDFIVFFFFLLLHPSSRWLRLPSFLPKTSQADLNDLTAQIKNVVPRWILVGWLVRIYSSWRRWRRKEKYQPTALFKHGDFSELGWVNAEPFHHLFFVASFMGANKTVCKGNFWRWSVVRQGIRKRIKMQTTC